jgi:hypothetical protein
MQGVVGVTDNTLVIESRFAAQRGHPEAIRRAVMIRMMRTFQDQGDAQPTRRYLSRLEQFPHYVIASAVPVRPRCQSQAGHMTTKLQVWSARLFRSKIR